MKAPNSGDEESRRTRQNVIVLCFLLGLLVVGLWLFSALRAYLRVEACVEAGYRNCDANERGAR
jgi:hypothetical protein